MNSQEKSQTQKNEEQQNRRKTIWYRLFRTTAGIVGLTCVILGVVLTLGATKAYEKYWKGPDPQIDSLQKIIAMQKKESEKHTGILDSTLKVSMDQKEILGSQTGELQTQTQELKNQSRELSSQTDILQDGFKQLIAALKTESGSVEVSRIVNNLEPVVEKVSGTTDKIVAGTDELINLSSQYKRINIDKFSIPVGGTSGFRIDRDNQLAVLYDRGNSVNIKINFNGNNRWVDRGDTIHFVDEKRNDAVLSYMGVVDSLYIFHYAVSKFN